MESIYKKYHRKKLSNFFMRFKGYEYNLYSAIEACDFKEMDRILHRKLISFYAAKHEGTKSFAEYFNNRPIIDLHEELSLAWRTKRVIPASWFKTENAYVIVNELVKVYGVKKILDPFMGWGARGAATLMNRISYVGVDANPLLYGELTSLYEDFLNTGLTLEKFNSFKEKNKFDQYEYDAVFTCPPYWKAEDYSYKIDTIKTYGMFMRELIVLLTSFFINPEMKVMALCVDNFIYKSRSYEFQNDVIKIFESLNYEIKYLFYSKSREENYALVIHKTDKSIMDLSKIRLRV